MRALLKIARLSAQGVNTVGMATACLGVGQEKLLEQLWRLSVPVILRPRLQALGEAAEGLERDNGEQKKMLADSLLKNRVPGAINAKNGEPGEQATNGRLRRRRRPVFRASGLPPPSWRSRSIAWTASCAHNTRT